MEFGIIGIVWLALAVWAGLNVIQSGAETLSKVLWIVGLIVFPFVGFIVWFFAGPRKIG